MFTNTEIEQDEIKKNTHSFEAALSPNKDEQKLLSTLKNIGKLPEGFDGQMFLPLLKHENPKIRCLAIKNIGKLKDKRYLKRLSSFAKTEDNTLTRREAVSAIGRLKSEDTVPILSEFISDSDPKVILQALRELLYFKEHPVVKSALKVIIDHPNELIREHIARELRSQNETTVSKDQNHSLCPDTLKNILVCADDQEALSLFQTSLYI